MSSQDIIQAITHAIASQDPGAQVFLFGSRARHTNRPDSDWDILILVDNPQVSDEVENKFRDVLYDIEIESGQIISSLIYSKSVWKNKMPASPLFHAVKKDGVLLS